ncbi:DUF4386 domain-containing protein [Inquilinus sp. KBS0705]|nr:DUF4386 domain-containing protein [Inquilinus sp. KBS0705]
MNPHGKTALAAGICYLLTFISIPTIVLYSPIHHQNYSGADTAVLVGGILEIIVALAGMGTAIALYPVLKMQHEGLALGFIASRTLEAGTIFVGVAFLFAAVSLRHTETLVVLYDRMFLIGQSLISAINAVLLGFLIYRSRLVPRVLPILGFVGAALLLISWAAILFGFMGRLSPVAGMMGLPIATWEFSLGLYLIIKGFKNGKQ